MNPGDVVADRFEIESEAGSGGMGTVYRALDRQTRTTIALKILHSQSTADAERFAREVTILAELEHPHVVRYVGSGITTTGQRFLAMEWLEGDDLAVHLTRRGMTIAESLDVIRRAAEALAVAHRRGIVHRDLKPNNLFVPGGDTTRLKVLDFGIARRTREQHGLTRTGVIIGTPEYMAPEQARGSREVDARSDVFALGCVLFECITGRAAFVGDNLIAVLAKILLEEAPRLSELRTDIPPAVDALVARMLSKRPEGRQADGAELAREILALGQIDGAAAAPVGVAPAALTTNEQRMVSIVFAGGQHRHTDGMAATLHIDTQPDLAAAVRAIVEPFGARVETLADGSIVAMLSGSDAATDQASRVARCALAMRPLLAEAPMVLVTGRGVISTRMPMGEVIDRAVRVLPLARPGGVIRIDEATAGLLGTRFDVGGDGGGLFLRGERDTFESVRTILGKETSFVGRDRESKALEAVLDEVASEPVARAVLVTGAAGAGKSRLLQEFVKRVRSREQPVEILTARGDSLSAGSPFGMLAPAIRRAAGVLDGEPIEVQRRKIRCRVARHVAAEHVQRVSEFLGELASVSFTGATSPALTAARTDAILMGDGMRMAFEDWLMAESGAQPVLLLLEDLHWGDLPTVKFVDSALRVLRDRAFMVLAVARPEVHKQFPGLWAERELNEIKLGAITKKSAERLVREVLGETPSAQVVTRLVERADGNAFYLEELIRAVGSGVAADQLPDSVLGMVQARLDALGNEARRVLRAASVFGQTFWRGGVMNLLGGDHRTTGVMEWLDELVGREVIARSNSPTLPGETEYVFRNALVRDATYAMLTEEDRVLGHRLAGAWLQQAGESNAIVLAQHFEQGKEPQRAGECYGRAAEQALEGNDIAEAIARGTRAIALGATGKALGKLELIRSEAHFFRGEHHEAENCATAAAACFEPGHAEWFAAMALMTLPAGQRGELDRAESRLRTMMAQLPVDSRAGNAKICALFQSGMQFMQSSRPQLYVEVNEAFEKVAQATPDLGPRAVAFVQLLKATPMYASDLATAFLGLEAGLAAVEQTSDARFAVTARSNVGYVASELGNYERAEEVLRASIAAAERMGAHHTANLALHNLGNVVGVLGRLDEARDMELRAIEAFVKQGNPRLEGASRIYLAGILFRQGDALGAEREARAAIAVLTQHPMLRPDARSALARALLAQDRRAEALEAAREAVAEIETTEHWRRVRALHNLVLAEALEANGDREGASAALRVSQKMVLAVGAKIADVAVRERLFTRVPDNARVFELCARWGLQGE